MNNQTLVKTGIIGAVIAALCCATPVLVILLGAVGLSALTGYLDYVLLPALAVCIGLIGYGLYRQRRSRTAA
jgi:mercuric ion transport protein